MESGKTFLNREPGRNYITDLVFTVDEFPKSKAFEKEYVNDVLGLWDDIVRDCQRVLHEFG